MGFIFDILTDPLSLSLEPIYEYLVLSIIGIIAFKISYSLVGEIGFDNSGINTVLHWTIRFAVFACLWAIVEFCIRVYLWVNLYKKELLFVLITILLGFGLYYVIKKRKVVNDGERDKE